MTTNKAEEKQGKFTTGHENIWGRGDQAEIEAHVTAQRAQTLVDKGAAEYVLIWQDPAGIVEFHKSGFWNADVFHALTVSDEQEIQSMKTGEIKTFGNMKVVRV